MKAILVIDMPQNCAQCPFIYDKDACYAMNKPTGLWLPLVCNGSTGEYGINKFPYEEKRVDWCPLRPMPQKKEVEVNGIEDIMHTEYSIEDITNKYIANIQLATDKLISLGWNACLDEIGEQDEDTV